MCGAPAEAATSRSPVVSITTLPRIASRPLLVSQTTPLTWPSSTSVRENHECRRRLMPACCTISSEARLKASGSKAAAKQIGCGFSLLWKSKVPQRFQRRTDSGSAAPVLLLRVLGQAARGHALDHLEADAAHRDFLLVAVPHVVQHQHHAARGEAAEVVVALQQRDAGTVACGGQRGGLAGGTAADHHHIRFGCHANVVRRLMHPVANTAHNDSPD